MSRTRTPAEHEAVFWLRVNKTDTCWLWTGGQTSKGPAGGSKYGSYKYPGGTLAHRYSWELANGSTVPEGLAVCHHCDTPLCVRPDHLYVGTQQRNMLDSVRRGRIRRKGEINGNAKLTIEQIYEIRASKLGFAELACQYGVCEGSIRQIQARKRWGHLPERA